MKVDEQTWLTKMNNLNERRSKEVIKNAIPEVDDYCSHINKAIKGVGKNVLDVGCGFCLIKNCLTDIVNYVGIDPFPMVDGVIEMTIENCTFKDQQFDTVYCFAALDNVIDFKAAINNIKRVCKTNVLFLSGVDIEPDKYHTIKLTESMIVEEMKPFSIGYKEYFHPKIMLIEFYR